MSNNSSSTEQQLLDLKAKVDTLTKVRDQAQWEVDRALSELRDKYGIGSVEEADAKVEELEREAFALEKEVADSLTRIKTRYADLLALADTEGATR